MDNKLICCKCKQRPAVIFVSKIDGTETTQEGYCLKCATELNIGPIKQVLDSMGIKEDDIDQVAAEFDNMMDGLDGFEMGGAGTFPFMNMGKLFGNNNPFPKADGTDGDESEDGADSASDDASSDNGKSDNKKPRFPRNKKKNKHKYLGIYTTNLNEKARSGKIDDVIGREKEMARTIQILCRRKKNNPCFIGEPGVGKTSIAEGLAMKIVSGDDIPANLMDKEIHLLDLTALVAGTQFRGQFESRVKGLVDEVKSEGNIILFVDEIHTLVGTGDSEGSMNAANILKPELAKGSFQMMGATTFNEYRKYIEKDAALERRFQPVKVDEPSISECYDMLLGIKSKYEDFHKVRISDALLYRAVTLSEKYINDRFLPDKAIDLLDEACASASIRNVAISKVQYIAKRLTELDNEIDALFNDTADDNEPDYEAISSLRAEKNALSRDLAEYEKEAKENDVLESDIAKVINDWTGIPAAKIIENDLNKLAGMEAKLKERIIGQDEAIEVLSAAIRRNRIQISAVRKPAPFLFVGPTGVGKTELAKQVANELFSTPETLIRFNMNEFMEKHSVSRLIGSPPGYVGYDEAGQLTEKVRRKPYSVILFDEIEKAHPDVLNILLQILDEGKTNDAQGRSVSFENAVIIMTSNAGSNVTENAMGFNRDRNEASKDKAMKALKEFLRPEFLGRVDEIVVFNNLKKDDLIEISRVLIKELIEILEERGIKVSVSEDVYATIAELSENGGRGARDIRRTIRKEIEDSIANILVNNAQGFVNELIFNVVDGKITTDFK